jgi:hypothetical protein
MYTQHHPDAAGGHAKRHPKLVFRAEDPALNLTARRFQGVSITQRPSYRSEEFRQEAWSHLYKYDMDFQSPFISLTEFSSVALQLVAHASSPKILYIWAFNDLVDEAFNDESQRKASTKMVPRLVPTIVKDHSFDGDNSLPGKYAGRGEVLLTLIR